MGHPLVQLHAIGEKPISLALLVPARFLERGVQPSLPVWKSNFGRPHAIDATLSPWLRRLDGVEAHEGLRNDFHTDSCGSWWMRGEAMRQGLRGWDRVAANAHPSMSMPDCADNPTSRPRCRSTPSWATKEPIFVTSASSDWGEVIRLLECSSWYDRSTLSIEGGSTVSDNIAAAVRSVSSVMRSKTTLSRGWRWISDVVNAFILKYLSLPYNR